MSNFTPAIAAALAGPAWLQSRRVQAAERLTASSLPTTDEEIWRYSRIGDLDLDAFAPVAHSLAEAVAARSMTAQSVAGSDDEVQLRSLNPAGIVVTINGSLAAYELDPAIAAKGVRFGEVVDPNALGSVMIEPTDFFAVANDAFTVTPLSITVPRGVAIERPLVVVHRVTSAGAAVFPRLVIEASENSEVTVLEQFTSTPVKALMVPVTEVRAAQAARVRYLGVNLLGPEVWSIASLVSEGGRDSHTVLSSVALGGDYARSRIDARLTGQGGHTEQIAVYFGEATQMHDFRTLQDHAAPKTTSNLLFKGAVEGHAASVYTGLIKVRKEAVGTVAFQANRNIKLSDGAWAESVPNLDIETNDVKCSHASAVGPIDEDQRFYLESRGVPTAVAERLIVTGFFDEVLGRLPVPEVVGPLRANVAAKLDRRDL